VRFQASGWEGHEGERPPWRKESGKDKRHANAGSPTSYEGISKNIEDKMSDEARAYRKAQRQELKRDNAHAWKQTLEEEAASEVDEEFFPEEVHRI
jgi:hypothetical protein